MKRSGICGLALSVVVLGGCTFDVNIYEGGEGEEFEREVVAAPVVIEAPALHRDGRLVFSGQPDEGTLRAVVAGGAGTVVNFRRESEMKDLPFDEGDIVEDAGGSYVHIPLGGSVGEEPGYDPEDVDRLAEVLKGAGGDVYMHCASGGRARTIWTAYLVKYEGLSEEEATLRAQRAGQEPTPLERLLGKPSAFTAPSKDE